MHARKPHRPYKPRELRRRVLVTARLRDGATWSDTCILNISSRGLLIQTRQPLTEGKEVEIRRGDHAILARVVWRDGARTGLQAEDRVPVEEIMTLGRSAGLQLTAEPHRERRRRPRPEDHSRLRGRAIEFLGIVLLAISLAATARGMVEQAFARPLAIVTAELGG